MNKYLYHTRRTTENVEQNYLRQKVLTVESKNDTTPQQQEHCTETLNFLYPTDINPRAEMKIDTIITWLLI